MFPERNFQTYKMFPQRKFQTSKMFPQRKFRILSPISHHLFRLFCSRSRFSARGFSREVSLPLHPTLYTARRALHRGSAAYTRKRRALARLFYFLAFTPYTLHPSSLRLRSAFALPSSSPFRGRSGGGFFCSFTHSQIHTSMCTVCSP